MKVQKLQRSRETFIERMATKDEKTIRSYGVAINNFENFCMEKYGIASKILKENSENLKLKLQKIVTCQ